MSIETRRTRLEVLGEHHAELMQQYYAENEAHLAPWEPLRPAGYHTAANWRFRGRQAEMDHAQGKSRRYVAILKSTGEIAAICNFTGITGPPMQACYLGYSVAKRFEGQGVMSEVVSAAVEHVFATLDLHRIMANYIPENARSGAMLARLGFQKEGLARSYLKIAGQWRDHVLTAKINPQHEAD
ncbi:MAG: GNAT family N-acetyltransferase [Henriciella sp.]|nr:GNAT family N-acetyltransferase [Henriciella sp.]